MLRLLEIIGTTRVLVIFNHVTNNSLSLSLPNAIAVGNKIEMLLSFFFVRAIGMEIFLLRIVGASDESGHVGHKNTRGTRH